MIVACSVKSVSTLILFAKTAAQALRTEQSGSMHAWHAHACCSTSLPRPSEHAKYILVQPAGSSSWQLLGTHMLRA